MATLTTVDPATIDFSNVPADLSASQVSKLRKLRQTLDESNFDKFIIPKIDKNDVSVLKKDIKAACLKEKTKMLKSTRQKLKSSEKLEDEVKKQEDISKVNKRVNVLNALSDDMLTDLAWADHLAHHLTSVKYSEDELEASRLAKEIVNSQAVKDSIERVRKTIKRVRHDQERKEKKKKMEKQEKLKAADTDKTQELNAAAAAKEEIKKKKIEEEKAKTAQKEMKLRQRVMEKLEIGTRLFCVVQGSADFGLFLETYYKDVHLKVLCHVYDASARGASINSETLRERFEVGDRVTAVVSSVDIEKDRIKVSFKDSDFKTLEPRHRHMKGNAPPGYYSQTKSKLTQAESKAGISLASVRIDSLATGPEKSKWKYFEEGMVIVRKLNCRSQNEKHKGAKMSDRMRVKLEAEFYCLDVKHEYSRYVHKCREAKKERALARAAEGGNADLSDDSDDEEEVEEQRTKRKLDSDTDDDDVDERANNKKPRLE